MTGTTRIERILRNPRDQIRLRDQISTREAADIAGLCASAGAAEFAVTLILDPRIGIARLGASRAPH